LARRPRLTIASRGSGLFPGELPHGTSRQSRDLTAPVPVPVLPGALLPRLRRDPGSHGQPGHPPAFADRTWQEWRWPGCQDPCGQPLVPTGIRDPFESFRIRSPT
jgi:hypothetical protein